MNAARSERTAADHPSETAIGPLVPSSHGEDDDFLASVVDEVDDPPVSHPDSVGSLA